MKSKMKMASILSLLGMFALLMSACETNISRNADGSLNIQTKVSQQELQTEINAALADPLITNLNVSLQSGFILVTGQRQRVNDGSQTDTISFRLDLGASDGHLTASISNAQLDGVAIEQNRVDVWNQTIANRIEHLGQRRSNARLQSVSITPDALTMNWLVSKN